MRYRTPAEVPRNRVFASTRWTIVRDAADSRASESDALAALSQLCQIYWRPVYLFVRSQGSNQHDAQDLTQGFFAHLIDSRAYARADQTKGRFRSFLLGALKHFLADARDRARAQKRGGGVVLAELDDAAISEAEAQALRNHHTTPERVYEREWAAALLQRTLDRLAEESALAGKAALFDALKSHLGASAANSVRYDQLALRTGRPATTLRSDVARLRMRYRAMLREEVRNTVAADIDVDGELRHLCHLIAA